MCDGEINIKIFDINTEFASLTVNYSVEMLP